MRRIVGAPESDGLSIGLRGVTLTTLPKRREPSPGFPPADPPCCASLPACDDGGGKRQALFAIDIHGATRGSIPVAGLHYRDWEDIASGVVTRVAKVLPYFTRFKDRHIGRCCSFFAGGLPATSEVRLIYPFHDAAFRGA